MSSQSSDRQQPVDSESRNHAYVPLEAQNASGKILETTQTHSLH